MLRLCIKKVPTHSRSNVVIVEQVANTSACDAKERSSTQTGEETENKESRCIQHDLWRRKYCDGHWMDVPMSGGNAVGQVSAKKRTYDVR